MRIVSLVPSVTETLSAWDRAPVACTRFCERPDLERVGGTKNPDLERVVRLRPDLVVMDAEENRREDYDALVGAVIRARAARALTERREPRDGRAGRKGRSGVDATRDRPRDADALTRVRADLATPVPRSRHTDLRRVAAGALGVATVFDDEGPYPEIALARRRRAAARRRARARASPIPSAGANWPSSSRWRHRVPRRQGPLLVGRAHARRPRSPGRRGEGDKAEGTSRAVDLGNRRFNAGLLGQPGPASCNSI